MQLHKFVWVESIDFGDHIDDTNQLPIIRGASLALSEMGTAFGGKAVFEGSSSVLFKGNDKRTIDDTVGASKALTHMRFSQGIGEDQDEEIAIRKAFARARFGQITGDFIRPELMDAKSMCALTRKLPGETPVKLSTEQIKRLNTGTDRTDGTIASSTSAQDRRTYGKTARSSYLKNRLELDDLAFTSDLHQLSKKAVAMEEVPISVNNRIALFYADGNSFSAIRKKLDGTAKALSAFSKSVNNLILEGALQQIVKHLKNGACQEANGTAFHKGDEKRLRFEILICGGDEFCFIAPAWLGLELARIFLQAIEGAKHQDHPLQFKAGLVFANCKTPIAPLRMAAVSLADKCRIECKNSIGIHAFESIQPTSQGFDAVRETVFGNTKYDSDGKPEPDPAALTATRFQELLKTIKALKANCMPRSQLYKTIRAARGEIFRSKDRISTTPAIDRAEKPPLITDSSAVEAAKTWVDGYNGPAQDTFKGAFADAPNCAVQAWLIAHLWDYVWEAGVASKTTDGDSQ